MRMDSRLSLFAAVAAVALSSGCATLDLPWPNRVPEASLKNPVVRVLCLWEPSEGRDHHGKTCRGFAGQVLFLGNQGGSPVKVDGDVRVFEFDDLGTSEEQMQPLHQFDFIGPAWSRHLKVGSFGPAYHVFIPYMRPGLHEANCAVRLRFTPTSGQSVYSDLTNVYLKGKARADLAPPPSPIAPLSIPANHQVRTTTIPLEGRDDYSPMTPIDDSRANLLLQEFLHNQPPGETPAEIEPQESLPPVKSERIRWNGQRAEVMTRDEGTPVDHRRAPAVRQHPLSFGAETETDTTADPFESLR